ncbi:hypothetical protein QQS21_005448 [Conoideocrella luteorostrata]|uniref:Zn(2)-C6 fungal-type domain-containing protein n=1 Tax=Conoideocrella luteorostrata TaxID=1105319 RepID=A0AAJ0G0X9_9HYPO|nr:hypothetical protein QQS21_005448 [Conoideocrella luteorostrata]
MISSPSKQAPRRPNGRLQACDPCRKRKVACDHAQPVCNRCRARNQAKKCVYIVGNTRLTPRPNSPIGNDEDLDFNTLAGTSSPLVSVSGRALSTGTIGQTRTEGNAEQLGTSSVELPSGPGTGFLGMTSHSAVYDETTQTLSLLQGFQACLPVPEKVKQKQRSRSESEVLLSPTREMCLVVLRSIPSYVEGLIPPLIAPHPYDGWARLAAQRIFESLYSQFGSYLGLKRKDSELEKMAMYLTRNTIQPLDDTITDPDGWIAQFSDRNLRWESLGLLFSIKEIGKRRLSDQQDISNESFKGRWREVARVCLGLTIDLARRFSDGNSILVQLCIRQTVAESIITGDASLSCWRAMAESVAMLTFLGFHAESSSPSYQPCLSSEARRRVTAHVFIMDKVVTLFTGRPPQISRRYVSTPPPLDLDDDEILADEAQVAEYVRSLDQNGWNTKGGLFAATALRCRYFIALIRDELIEIALGNSKLATIESLLDLKGREIETMAGFPESATYRDGDFDNPSTDTLRLSTQLFIKLEHMQNLFVVERLLLRHGHTDNGELISTSFELVSKALLFWTNKDRLSLLREDFAWLVMAYATPGGGILCMELLNASFSGKHTQNLKITRSSIIQQLSLLIGFLDWVGPTGTNGDMCASCSSVIRAVLDHTLNAKEDESWPPINLDLDSMHLDFNFELFDTFDWLRPDVPMTPTS